MPPIDLSKIHTRQIQVVLQLLVQGVQPIAGLGVRHQGQYPTRIAAAQFA